MGNAWEWSWNPTFEAINRIYGLTLKFKFILQLVEVIKILARLLAQVINVELAFIPAEMEL